MSHSRSPLHSAFGLLLLTQLMLSAASAAPRDGVDFFVALHPHWEELGQQSVAESGLKSRGRTIRWSAFSDGHSVENERETLSEKGLKVLFISETLNDHFGHFVKFELVLAEDARLVELGEVQIALEFAGSNGKEAFRYFN